MLYSVFFSPQKMLYTCIPQKTMLIYALKVKYKLSCYLLLVFPLHLPSNSLQSTITTMDKAGNVVLDIESLIQPQDRTCSGSPKLKVSDSYLLLFNLRINVLFSKSARISNAQHIRCVLILQKALSRKGSWRWAKQGSEGQEVDEAPKKLVVKGITLLPVSLSK